MNTGDTHEMAAARLAEELALAHGIEPNTAKQIGYATALHDVGKMMIPYDIRGKPAALTPAEFERMKAHTIWGANILRRLPGSFGTMAREIALYHHERWDKKGYWGRDAAKLPAHVQIASICDVYTALICPNRSYKRTWSVDEALNYIQAEAGTRFNPALAGAFLSIPSIKREVFHAKTKQT